MLDSSDVPWADFQCSVDFFHYYIHIFSDDDNY